MIIDYDLLKTKDLDWMLTVEVPKEHGLANDPDDGELIVSDQSIRVIRAGRTLHLAPLNEAGLADLRSDHRETVIVAELVDRIAVVFYEAALTLASPADV